MYLSDTSERLYTSDQKWQHFKLLNDSVTVVNLYNFEYTLNKPRIASFGNVYVDSVMLHPSTIWLSDDVICVNMTHVCTMLF